MGPPQLEGHEGRRAPALQILSSRETWPLSHEPAKWSSPRRPSSHPTQAHPTFRQVRCRTSRCRSTSRRCPRRRPSSAACCRATESRRRSYSRSRRTCGSGSRRRRKKRTLCYGLLGVVELVCGSGARRGELEAVRQGDSSPPDERPRWPRLVGSASSMSYKITSEIAFRARRASPDRAATPHAPRPSRSSCPSFAGLAADLSSRPPVLVLRHSAPPPARSQSAPRAPSSRAGAPPSTARQGRYSSSSSTTSSRVGPVATRRCARRSARRGGWPSSRTVATQARREVTASSLLGPSTGGTSPSVRPHHFS